LPTALITGITGQDGHYLSKLLLARGYAVVGVSRQAQRLATADGLTLRNLDVADTKALEELFGNFAFDEIYNLAGPSFGPASWEQPLESVQTMGVAVVAMLELVRRSGRPIHFFQASSSELFGRAAESPQRESTPFRPVTPYGFAKLMAHAAVGAYRQRHGLFACCGILFNHESPLRGETFVTRKITRALARIKLGLQDTVFLGNLNAKRDWGHAKDYVEMQWLMLQQKTAEDFVIATGEQHSVRDFVNAAAREVGFKVTWKGKGVKEKGYADGKCIVAVDPRYFRPTEVETLLGDASKARKKLGWSPKIRFAELVSEMMREDLRAAERDELVKKHGFATYDRHE